MTESVLWLAHELLVIALCGCLLAIVVEGFLRDRAEARHDRRRTWHGR